MTTVIAEDAEGTVGAEKRCEGTASETQGSPCTTSRQRTYAPTRHSRFSATTVSSARPAITVVATRDTESTATHTKYSAPPGLR